MQTFEVVIAGGGLTAARAIKSYYEAGGVGRTALLARESVLPYHRPPLSKRYLRGETIETPFAEHESFYRDHEVDVQLETPVVSLDPASRVVTTPHGSLHYEQLLIATGARPRRLRVFGDELEGVFSLRTLQDSDRIRGAADFADRAVVVGGGFIGMEVAASLRHLGLEVTLIHKGRGLFDQLGCSEFSDELLSLYRERGVDVRLGEEVASFNGDGRLEYVEAKSGFGAEADLAVVGIGVLPNVEFLAGSGIEIDDGVVVTERFETNVPGVYAAGDVANFFDPLFLRQRRIEHWSNANYQGTQVGHVLAGHGRGDGYDTVSSFFSEVFGLTIKVLGDVSRFDELTTDGSLFSGAFLASYGDEGRLVGALAVGLDDRVERQLKDLIKERTAMPALRDDLVDSGRSR